MIFLKINLKNDTKIINLKKTFFLLFFICYLIFNALILILNAYKPLFNNIFFIQLSVNKLLVFREVLHIESQSSKCEKLIPIPFMLQSDVKFSSLKSTRIFDHLISCFVIGGECRLCFPQMLGLVLPNLQPRQIDEMCIKLRISNMQASKEQLQILKLAGALPASAVNCELITKSNAERLIAQLVPPDNILLDETKKEERFILVYL